jgi:crossover junction endodeoxyribonuclease RuvC
MTKKKLQLPKQSPDKPKSGLILGIDPGTRITGYGVINHSHHPVPVDFGCIRPPHHLPTHERYLIIFNALDHLMEKYQPDAVAIETQFVYKNVQSAMKLGMARAMGLLAAARRQIPIFEYAPTKAKLAVVGNGGASKMQVQKMIQLLLRLPTLPEPEDAADALALAICHAHTIKTRC